MKRLWTIIGVRDVAASFKWYQSLFGQTEASPAHDDFGQIVDIDGTVLLCLHQWGAHGHPTLASPDRAAPGNGLLLFFRVDDFDLALTRARALVSRFEEDLHVNPNTRTREFSLRDPDGYYVTISALAESWEVALPEPRRKLEELMTEFANAWNRHDVDALMSMMTDDGVFEASSGADVDGERHQGAQAVRAAYTAVFRQYPDAHWGNPRHWAYGDRGVSEWTFTGTRSDGKRVEVNGCDLFTFRDGRIAVKNSFRKNRA